MFTKRIKKICPVFLKQEAIIRDIMQKINHADAIAEKAGFVEELQREIAVLLSCSEYAAKKNECANCHFIANLRKKSSDLIMKVDKLGEHKVGKHA